jgi:uncharacterized protein YcgI (DUF1989 family)
MNVPVQPDGTMGIVDGRSKPGHYVELRAESRVLAVGRTARTRTTRATGSTPRRSA